MVLPQRGWRPSYLGLASGLAVVGSDDPGLAAAYVPSGMLVVRLAVDWGWTRSSRVFHADARELRVKLRPGGDGCSTSPSTVIVQRAGSIRGVTLTVSTFGDLWTIESWPSTQSR